MAAALIKNNTVLSLGIDCETSIPLETPLIAQIATEQEIKDYRITQERKMYSPYQPANSLQKYYLKNEEHWAKLIFRVSVVLQWFYKDIHKLDRLFAID